MVVPEAEASRYNKNSNIKRPTFSYAPLSRVPALGEPENAVLSMLSETAPSFVHSLFKSKEHYLLCPLRTKSTRIVDPLTILECS